MVVFEHYDLENKSTERDKGKLTDDGKSLWLPETHYELSEFQCIFFLCALSVKTSETSGS